MKESTKLLLIVGIFLLVYYMPLESSRVQGAVIEGLYMVQEYAREHTLFCLVPAFFIAGAMENFISHQSVIRYLGGGASRWVAYAVASVSGAILAVCSCTVLPLFMGIYRRGAGLGPASAFLYSGPAINVLAIIMTARVLGWQIGVARVVGAVLFSLVVGILMELFFRKEETERQKQFATASAEPGRRSLGQTAAYFAVLVLILVFAAWGRPPENIGFFQTVFTVKWYLVTVLLVVLAYMLAKWFDREELGAWVTSTWDFAQRILPLLLGGVFISGVLMGRPGTDAGLIPSAWIAGLLGGNSLRANLVASVSGALMYFATLTEVPIIQGLLGSGMGRGPALALLLAGPALSLPSMVVIETTLGPKKATTYITLVVVMATVAGILFGFLGA